MRFCDPKLRFSAAVSVMPLTVGQGLRVRVRGLGLGSHAVSSRYPTIAMCQSTLWASGNHRRTCRHGNYWQNTPFRSTQRSTVKGSVQTLGIPLAMSNQPPQTPAAPRHQPPPLPGAPTASRPCNQPRPATSHPRHQQLSVSSLAPPQAVPANRLSQGKPPQLPATPAASRLCRQLRPARQPPALLVASGRGEVAVQHGPTRRGTGSRSGRNGGGREHVA